MSGRMDTGGDRAALPAVSVVLGVRDAAASVEDTVSSVLEQSLADFECIVVDDGSSDDTRRRVAALAARDARIRLIAQAPAGLTRVKAHPRLVVAGDRPRPGARVERLQRVAVDSLVVV